MCTVYLISAPEQPGRKRMYIKEAYCPNIYTVIFPENMPPLLCVSFSGWHALLASYRKFMPKNLWWCVVGRSWAEVLTQHAVFLKSDARKIFFGEQLSYHAWIISYLKCSNWHRKSKLLSNFVCLFTFCYLDRANSIKIT